MNGDNAMPAVWLSLSKFFREQRAKLSNDSIQDASFLQEIIFAKLIEFIHKNEVTSIVMSNQTFSGKNVHDYSLFSLRDNPLGHTLTHLHLYGLARENELPILARTICFNLKVLKCLQFVMGTGTRNDSGKSAIAAPFVLQFPIVTLYYPWNEKELTFILKCLDLKVVKNKVKFAKIRSAKFKRSMSRQILAALEKHQGMVSNAIIDDILVFPIASPERSFLENLIKQHQAKKPKSSLNVDFSLKPGQNFDLSSLY